MNISCIALLTASIGGTDVRTADEPALDSSTLAPPVRLEAGGVPIDVSIGHAAPHVMDFDGDGVRDLLVGEFGEGAFAEERLPEEHRGRKSPFAEGKLRVYRNVGTNEAPAFEDFVYLRAGKEYASIPTT
ncbi:MAG: hypothetical protein GY711_25055 [bacterium]|nr:hypothetical protein [bacterium]